MLQLSVNGGVTVKEEKRVECNGIEDIEKVSTKRLENRGDNNSKLSSPDHRDSIIGNQVVSVNATKGSSTDPNLKPVSSIKKDSTMMNQEDQLESTKVEVGEIREENERLKMVLARIMKDYQSLQMHFYNMIQQEQVKEPTETTSIDQEKEEPEFISLSLGTTATKEEKTTNYSESKEDKELKESLTLGLDCKFERSDSGVNNPSANLSTENSFEEAKEEEIGEPWPPSRALKTPRSGDDEVSQQTHVKKARVSVRARCEAPTMNDGCQWRKYGQKIAKGNPCPRAYYRCTVAPACPVRKQVQRCAEDMSILITTYEGTHNHPLPVSAAAIASTTSAAVCMLTSGSSSSRQPIGGSATTAADLYGLNSSLFDNSRSKQFYLPNPSITSTPSHPTITLDLTSTPSSSSLSSQFNKFSSNFISAPRHLSTSFNFSSSESNILQPSWNSNAYPYNLVNQHHYNKNPIGSLNLMRQPQEHLSPSYMQKNNSAQQPLMPEAITAIMSNPSFRSALATAITSVVSNGVGGHGNQRVGEHLRENLKWGEGFAAISPYSTPQNGNGCASTYLNQSSSSNKQQGT